MDKMTSVTGQGNNRVVYTNNKTVTLFSFHTFILDFFCLFKEKKLLYRSKSMHNSPFQLYSEMIKKKKGEEEKSLTNH